MKTLLLVPAIAASLVGFGSLKTYEFGDIRVTAPTRKAAVRYHAMVAVADAMVTVRRDARPALPDDFNGRYRTVDRAVAGPTTAPFPSATAEASPTTRKRLPIYVFSTANCGPCEAAMRALEATDRFEPRKIDEPELVPTWVESYPVLFWRPPGGRTWRQTGWSNLSEFEASFRRSSAEK